MSVRRIYFTLPKERRCCDSHCLGKKPGCKLSETLWRESRYTHKHTRHGSQQRSGAVFLCCVLIRTRFPCPLLHHETIAGRSALTLTPFGLHLRLLGLSRTAARLRGDRFHVPFHGCLSRLEASPLSNKHSSGFIKFKSTCAINFIVKKREFLFEFQSNLSMQNLLRLW